MMMTCSLLCLLRVNKQTSQSVGLFVNFIAHVRKYTHTIFNIVSYRTQSVAFIIVSSFIKYPK